jgi:hypothetical protein
MREIIRHILGNTDNNLEIKNNHWGLNVELKPLK